MTQASSVESINNQVKRNREGAIQMPFDGIIEAVAAKIGGDKAIEFERFMRFAFVGIIGAMIDLGVSNLLMFTVLPPEDAAGERLIINIMIAATISFICAVLSNFTWNRYWTYPDSRSRPIQQQLAQFAIVSVTGWTGRTIWIGVSSGFMIGLAGMVIGWLSLDGNTLPVTQIGATMSILTGIFVVMIWNFFVNRYWTYSDVDG